MESLNRIIYLKDEEIIEHSIVMIDFTIGISKSYYLWKKVGGKVSGSTIYLGEMLSNLILAPYWYPLRHNTTERFHAIGEPNIVNVGVLGYRNMTDEEKKEWTEKIMPISLLKDLLDILNPKLNK